jgi:hypothetical protein
MNTDLDDLLERWCDAPLLEVSEIIRGVSYTKGTAKSQPEPGLIPFLRALFRLAGAIEKWVATATARADKVTQAILAVKGQSDRQKSDPNK